MPILSRLIALELDNGPFTHCEPRTGLVPPRYGVTDTLRNPLSTLDPYIGLGEGYGLTLQNRVVVRVRILTNC